MTTTSLTIVEQARIKRQSKQYKKWMDAIETDITNDIQQYLTDNKITYSCNSPEFIAGLTLGLKVGTENLYRVMKKGTKPSLTEINETNIKLYKSIQNMKNE